MPVLAPATIADLAKESGIDVETIRSYQRLGLLPEPRRRKGRSAQLAYHREHVERLTFVWRAEKLGFSHDAIGEMLGLDGGMRTCADVRRIAERHLAEVRTRASREEIEHLESALVPLLNASPRSGWAKDSPIIVMMSYSA